MPITGQVFFQNKYIQSLLKRPVTSVRSIVNGGVAKLSRTSGSSVSSTTVTELIDLEVSQAVRGTEGVAQLGERKVGMGVAMKSEINVKKVKTGKFGKGGWVVGKNKVTEGVAKQQVQGVAGQSEGVAELSKFRDCRRMTEKFQRGVTEIQGVEHRPKVRGKTENVAEGVAQQKSEMQLGCGVAVEVEREERKVTVKNARSDNYWRNPESVVVGVALEGQRVDLGVAIERAAHRDKVQQKVTEVSGRLEGPTDTNTDSKLVLNSGTGKETQIVTEDDWLGRKLGVALFPRDIGDGVRQTMKMTEKEKEQKLTKMNGLKDRPTSYTQTECPLYVMSEEGRLCHFTEKSAHASSLVQVRRSPGQDCQDSGGEDERSQPAEKCQVRLPLITNSQGTPGSDRSRPSRTPPGTTSCSRTSTGPRPRRMEGSAGRGTGSPSCLSRTPTTRGESQSWWTHIEEPQSGTEPGRVDRIKREFEDRNRNKDGQRVKKKGRRRNGNNGGEGRNMVQSLIAQFLIQNKGGNVEGSGREQGVSGEKKRKLMEQCQYNGTGSSSKKSKTSQKQ